MTTIDARTRRLDIVLLCVAAAALRLPGLGAQLWFDEIWMIVDLVRLPLSELVTNYESDNNHPLYTWLATLSCRVFGESALAVRLPACLFGIASVPALYVLAERRLGRTVALGASLLLAFSSHAVWFSQNARGYTSLLFFSIMSSHYFMKLVEDRAGRSNVVLYAVTMALAIHTHLTACFMAAGHFVWWMMLLTDRARRSTDIFRRGLIGFTGGAAIALVLHAPILAPLYRFFVDGRSDRPPGKAEWTDPLWMLGEAARSLGMGTAVGAAALALVGLVLMVGLVRIGRRSPAFVVFLIAPAVIGSAALLGLNRNLWPRFFFFLFGFALVALVAGIEGVIARISREEKRARLLFVAVIGLGLLVNALRLPETYGSKQDFEAAANHARSVAAGRPVVTVGLAGFPYAEYFDEKFIDALSFEDFSSIRNSARAGVIVIVTFPIHLKWKHPRIAEVIGGEAVETARFTGSLRGGDVIIYELR